jgi:hypothetical protein
VTNVIASFADKLSGTTKEGICTSTNNNGFSFTLLYSRTRKDFITSFFTYG